jgi:RNA recognition motif-containing protein
VHIFVGNLALTTTEQDLRQLLEPYGTVATVRIITDRFTGRSRGFGFVDMPDSHAAQAVVYDLFREFIFSPKRVPLTP